METGEGMSQLEHPYIVTAGDATFSVRDHSICMLYTCNHEEADTRLVLHALLADSDVVVVCQRHRCPHSADLGI